MQLWDKDPIIGDDFIGETEIDMESRYFDEKWMCTEHYPIETRKVYLPESKQATGSVRLWTEIQLESTASLDKNVQVIGQKSELSNLGTSQSNSRVEYEKAVCNRRDWDISMMPPGGFELRVIVWDLQNCPIDDPEGLTDIYVTCSMPSYDSKIIMRTDTHIRSEGFVLCS